MGKSAEEIMVLRANELNWTVEEYKQYLLNTLDQYKGFRELQTKFARGVALESEERDGVIMVLKQYLRSVKEDLQIERKRTEKLQEDNRRLQRIVNGLAMDQIGHGA